MSPYRVADAAALGAEGPAAVDGVAAMLDGVELHDETVLRGAAAAGLSHEARRQQAVHERVRAHLQRVQANLQRITDHYEAVDRAAAPPPGWDRAADAEAREYSATVAAVEQHLERDGSEVAQGLSEARARVLAMEREQAAAAQRRADAAKTKADAEAAEAKASADAAAKAKSDSDAAAAAAASARAEAEAARSAKAKEEAAASAATANPANAKFVAEAKARSDLRAQMKAMIVAAKQRSPTGKLQGAGEVKKYINLRLGQISMSKAQCDKMSAELRTVLRQTAGAADPALGAYAQLEMAALFVKQGKIQIAMHQDSAYPFAAVAREVVQEFPQMRDLLLTRLEEQCVYCVPTLPPQESVDDTTMETVRGLMSFFAALIMEEDYAWTWLASFLNMCKVSPLSATVLLAFLQVAGPSMHQRFGQGFVQILAVVDKLELPAASMSAKTRLPLLVEEFKKTGRMPELKGRALDP